MCFWYLCYEPRRGWLALEETSHHQPDLQLKPPSAAYFCQTSFLYFLVDACEPNPTGVMKKKAHNGHELHLKAKAKAEEVRYLTYGKRSCTRTIEGRGIYCSEANALRFEENGQSSGLALAIRGEGGVRASPSDQIWPQIHVALAVADQDQLRH
nr:hypothetical protein TorRG33x02_089820 [Ipomoea batatas]